MNKREIKQNTPAEEAAIQRGIEADQDLADLTTEEIKAMRSFTELLEQKRLNL
jgi:hypothetical protein